MTEVKKGKDDWFDGVDCVCIVSGSHSGLFWLTRVPVSGKSSTTTSLAAALRDKKRRREREKTPFSNDCFTQRSQRRRA